MDKLGIQASAGLDPPFNEQDNPGRISAMQDQAVKV
jgi:hypothetical protein